MARIAGVAALLFLVLTAPAPAFDSCTYSAATHEVTAVFGAATGGTLSQSGTQIRADGVQCDSAATTANTDTIKVVGDDSDETLTIDLAGGSFLGGFTSEGTTDDEVEIEVDLGVNATSPSQPFELVVLGTPSVENIIVGLDGTFGSFFTAVNLNANESDGVDADVTFTDRVFADVRGLGGGDVLSALGGSGTGFETDPATTMLRGGPGNDDLGDGAVEPGPGNDTIRSSNFSLTRVFYTDAPNPVTVTIHGVTPGGYGGASNDGQAPPGVDTFVDGPPDGIDGSNNSGDVLTGSDFGAFLRGNDGDDTINGGAGDEFLIGGDGADIIHGGDGLDQLDGGDDTASDVLYGDGSADLLDGRLGNDTLSGGEGDDVLRQDSYLGFPGDDQNPDGADDISGGPGIDTVLYGNPFLDPFGRLAPVTVDLDDVADDGAAGEGDNVRSDVENIVGGLAGDTLTGDAGQNTITGYGGPDTIDGGTESDTISAGPGDDTIEVRDAFADTVTCGPGTDGGRRDAQDSLSSDCENVALPIDMPADPPLAPPSDPPVTTPPPATPPVVPPPPVTPPVAAPPISQLLSLPSRRRCASRRKFTVRVRSAIRGAVKRVTIFINGKRVKRVTGSRLNLPIDLRGLPKGKIRVRLRVELNDGRVATDTRTYRTCATKKRRGQFGRRG